MLWGPRLVRSTEQRVEWWDLKGSTVLLTVVGVVCLVAALLADGRHHRAVLRCARHAQADALDRIEDNDCVLTEMPRGIDRLWEKRQRSSFEISGAGLEVEATPFLGRPLWVSVNASDASAIRQSTEALVGRRLRGHLVKVGVVVTDEVGKRHVVHKFDDPGRAATALGAVQTYLAAARETPASLALRYDDSAPDEIVVGLCFLLLLAWAWRPVVEVVTLDTRAEVVGVTRRNVVGCRVFDFATALDNVAAVALVEFAHSDGHRLFGLRLVLADHNVELGFGDSFHDPSALKRLVEAANAILRHDKPDAAHADLKCAVCRHANRNTLLVPCHHLALCDGCAAKLAACPICRRSVQSRVRVYL